MCRVGGQIGAEPYPRPRRRDRMADWGGAPGAGHGRSRFAQRPEGGDYRTKALPDPDARPSVPLDSQRNLRASRRVPGPCPSPELSIPPHSPLPRPWPILRACRLQAGLATSPGLLASPAPLLMGRRESWGESTPHADSPLPLSYPLRDSHLEPSVPGVDPRSRLCASLSSRMFRPACCAPSHWTTHWLFLLLICTRPSCEASRPWVSLTPPLSSRRPSPWPSGAGISWPAP